MATSNIAFIHGNFSKFILKQIGDEIVKKWKTIPEDEHVPAREYMLAMVLKAIMLTSFGDFFKSHKQIVEFEKAYDIVSRI